MAGIDFIAMAAIAQELIDDNGREITLIRYKQAPADTDKPWEGPDDPRTSPDDTTTVIGCFVPMGGSGLAKEDVDADALKRTSEVCLIGPGAGFDLGKANELIDDGVSKKISFVQTLKPASTVLLYYVGISR